MRLKAERKFIDDNAHWLKLESPLAVCFLQNDEAMLAFSSKVLAWPGAFFHSCPLLFPDCNSRECCQAQFSTDGAVVNGVSHDDLYALWCRIAVLAWFGLAAKSSLGLVIRAACGRIGKGCGCDCCCCCCCGCCCCCCCSCCCCYRRCRCRCVCVWLWVWLWLRLWFFYDASAKTRYKRNNNMGKTSSNAREPTNTRSLTSFRKKLVK